MAVVLLDTNALIAIAWPTHPNHDSAFNWFKSLIPNPWATCPMTQCGFVRLSSDPRVIPNAVTPAAIELLKRLMAQPGHEFWPDAFNFRDASGVPFTKLQGHKQVNDSYLLALCEQRHGQVATLDKGLQTFAADVRLAHLVVPIPIT